MNLRKALASARTLHRGRNRAKRLGFILAWLLALLAPGCSPPSRPDHTTLPSRFFSEIQIIGSRGTALGQFNKPRSLALDAQDNLYVADLTGRVQKFSPAGA